MSFVVKTTTKIGLLDLIAPHSCRGCGQLGGVVCDRCKNNILAKQQRICPLCKKLVDNDQLKCADCDFAGAEVFAATRRAGWLGSLVGEFKMKSVRAAGDPLVEILDGAVQKSSLVKNDDIKQCDQVIVVPLPTIRRHVRERGFDHTTVIAKKLAKKHGWKMIKLLGRAKDSVQVGSSKNQRKTQAKTAYELLSDPEPAARYLLVDDIWTTGASIRAAVDLFLAAGIPREQIFAAVIALSE